jgi:hypothetical protein
MTGATRLLVNLFPLVIAYICAVECGRHQSVRPTPTPQEHRPAADCQPAPKETNKNMDALFEKAVVSYGKDYLEAELALRNGGSAATLFLQKNLTHPDPVARLMARCLLDWMEGNRPEYIAALNYLDTLPKILARTPITSPDPTASARYLTKHYGDRVADVLALRLVKETDWPHWRVMAVLFYLQEHHLPSTTAALIRFAAQTGNERWRDTAVQAIKAIEDPDLPAKITAERQRLEKLQRVLPPPLAALEAPKQK